eukprot:Clim_evm32s146 gene=Clim_evmTU32s146
MYNRVELALLIGAAAVVPVRGLVLSNPATQCDFNGTEIDCSGLEIEGIQDQAFTPEQYHSVESIDLSNNEIHTLGAAVFDKLVNLTWVDLTSNKLNAIDPDTFSGLPSLDTLVLGGNPGGCSTAECQDYCVDMNPSSAVSYFTKSGSCDIGKTGSCCDELCPEGCRTTGCLRFNSVNTGVKCVQCDDGFWGTDCVNECTVSDEVGGNCDLTGKLTCDQQSGNLTACAACKPGFYGATCSQECLAEDNVNSRCVGQLICAKDGSDVKCDAQGCMNGYYGDLCDKSCSSESCSGCGAENCVEGSEICDRTTGAIVSCGPDGNECNSGFIGIKCEDECGADDCDEDNPNSCCEQCEEGLTGATCEDTCPDTSEECTSVVSCDRYDSAKPLECDGCVTGLYGASCQRVCVGDRCADDADKVCEQNGGALTSCSACKNGFYGARCQSTCDIDKCDVDGAVVCNQVTGALESCERCIPGYYGTTCQFQCVTDFCEGAVTCDKESGQNAICESCQKSFWGDRCQFRCTAPENCEGFIECNKETGETEVCEVCQNEFWGKLCQNECPKGNCAFGDTAEVCDKDSGDPQVCGADGSCVNGFYGDGCTQICSSKRCKVVDACDSSNGAPTACSECQPGYYGTQCENLCQSVGCDGLASCDAEGNVVECVSGTCLPGYSGTACDVLTDDSTGQEDGGGGSNDTTIILVASIVGAAALIAIIVGAVVFKRRRDAREEGSDYSSSRKTPTAYVDGAGGMRGSLTPSCGDAAVNSQSGTFRERQVPVWRSTALSSEQGFWDSYNGGTTRTTGQMSGGSSSGATMFANRRLPQTPEEVHHASALPKNRGSNLSLDYSDEDMSGSGHGSSGAMRSLPPVADEHEYTYVRTRSNTDEADIVPEDVGYVNARARGTAVDDDNGYANAEVMDPDWEAAVNNLRSTSEQPSSMYNPYANDESPYENE